MAQPLDVRPVRALVLWADSRSANLGVRVLAEGSAALLRQALGDEVTITFQDFGANDRGFKPTMSLIKRDLTRRHGPIRTWLREFDLVLDTGAGDSFADIYGWERVFRMMYVQVAAALLGVPVVLGPQTIGPFTTLRMRTAARVALRRPTLVVTRDSTSLRYARRLGARRVLRATDVVFSLPRPARAEAHDVLLNVSGLLWNSDAHGDHRRYRAAVHALLDGLAERGRRVALLAHVLDNRTADNDVPVVRELAEERGLTAIVPENTADVRRVLASAQLVIGARMHACLNALSTGTPAIAWAYSRKFEPLLADLGWHHVVDLAASGDAAQQTLTIIDTMPAHRLLAEVHDLMQRTEERLAPVVDALSRAPRRGPGPALLGRRGAAEPSR